MREYKKIIILSSVLLVLIVLITLVMIFDIDMLLIKNLSIAGIENKKISVEELIKNENTEGMNNTAAKAAQQTSKNNFDVAKETYESIDESTISIVKEATKEEKYFIEYLWVVLDNYAKANGVKIQIITPNAGGEAATNSSNTENVQNENNAENITDFNENTESITNDATTQGSANTGIKITVTGRYANVADFVFDVENDKELRFKLDNIKMTYANDNSIQAMFDVLSLNVLN